MNLLLILYDYFERKRERDSERGEGGSERGRVIRDKFVFLL